MGEIVLVVVAAAWAAVLLPPLLRSRVQNRPNSSISDFNRQLGRLQGTVPGRAQAGMRASARPLAPAARPVGRPGDMRHGTIRPAETVDRRPLRHGDPSGQIQRPGRASSELVRRRRANTLAGLVLLTLSMLFLAATTQEVVLLYMFALAFLVLCGYVYLLISVRQRELDPVRSDVLRR